MGMGFPVMQPAQFHEVLSGQHLYPTSVISSLRQYRRSSFAKLWRINMEKKTQIHALAFQQNCITNQFRTLTSILMVLCPYRIEFRDVHKVPKSKWGFWIRIWTWTKIHVQMRCGALVGKTSCLHTRTFFLCGTPSRSFSTHLIWH